MTDKRQIIKSVGLCKTHRHLNDRVQRVNAVESRALDRHPDNRQVRFRGDHSGQVCGASSAGDNNADAARGSLLAKADHERWSAMGRDNASLERDLELFQNARGIAHSGKIGIGTHED